MKKKHHHLKTLLGSASSTDLPRDEEAGGLTRQQGPHGAGEILGPRLAQQAAGCEQWLLSQVQRYHLLQRSLMSQERWNFSSTSPLLAALPFGHAKRLGK